MRDFYKRHERRIKSIALCVGGAVVLLTIAPALPRTALITVALVTFWNIPIAVDG